jgi:hypothetical protein
MTVIEEKILLMRLKAEDAPENSRASFQKNL